jgi:HD superfamily phosphodiesterase
MDKPRFSRALRALSEPYLFNHAVRSWLFSVQLADLQGVSYDEEVVAVASLLHDIGLTKKYQDTRRALARRLAWTIGELSSSGTPKR